MEKIKINRNVDKGEVKQLVINYVEKRTIDGRDLLFFHLYSQFICHVGEHINLKKKLYKYFNEAEYEINKSFVIRYVEENYLSFAIDFPYRDIMKIEKITYTNYEEIPKNYLLRFNQNVNITEMDLKAEDDNIENDFNEWYESGNLTIDAWDEKKNHFTLSGISIFDDEEYGEILGKYEKTDVLLPRILNSLYINQFDKDVREGYHCRISGSDFIYYNNDNYNVFPNVTVEYYSPSFNVGIILNENFDTGLYNEDNSYKIIHRAKENLIPEVIDMEKLMFSPYVLDPKLKNEDIAKIIINPHFRIRELNSSWNIMKNRKRTDEGIEENVVDSYWFSSDNNGDIDKNRLNKADSFVDMSFNVSDFYYRKSRLAKSFIRLSFFDSKNVFEQQLLFYSTIFYDANDIFGKYLKIAINNPEETIGEDVNFLVESPGVPKEYIDDLKSINSQMVLTDMYDESSSSEGFYIYLFPNIVLDEENFERDIYMKVEFNHAGNGKTIPLLLPNSKSSVDRYNNRTEGGPRKNYYVNDIENRGLPVDIDIQSYFDDLFIKVHLKYLKDDKKFVFDIPQAIHKGNEIVLNLFEAKMN